MLRAEVPGEAGSPEEGAYCFPMLVTKVMVVSLPQVVAPEVGSSWISVLALPSMSVAAKTKEGAPQPFVLVIGVDVVGEVEPKV